MVPDTFREFGLIIVILSALGLIIVVVVARTGLILDQMDTLRKSLNDDEWKGT